MDKRIIISKVRSGSGFKYIMQCLNCAVHFSILGGVFNAGHGKYFKNACSFKAQCKNIKHPRWNGGKIKRTGYWYINQPEHPFSGKQGYIAEHRLVMEKLRLSSIGRKPVNAFKKGHTPWNKKH